MRPAIVTPGKRYDLGLGWLRPHRDTERGLTWIQHLGGGGGYGTVMRLWPDRGRGVVAMANVSFQRFDYETLLKALAAGTHPRSPPAIGRGSIGCDHPTV